MLGTNNNTNIKNGYVPAFRATEQSKIPIITKPIDKVESIVNDTVDVFVPETIDEEKKKSHKTMIRVGSIVLVLSAFVALLNPKFSATLVNKLKTKSAKAGNKAKVDNSIVGTWNKIKSKFLSWTTNGIQVINNYNSTKDELFQKLCGKTGITKKMHSGITKWFDGISKHTVFSKNSQATEKIETLNNIINEYKSRLSKEKQAVFETKLNEIINVQEYFKKSKTEARLKHQEELMQNLEKETMDKIVKYKNGFFDKNTNKLEHSKDIFNFWAEDILMPQRNKLEEEGKAVIDSLVGDGKNVKGKYKELMEMLSPHLKQEEMGALEESIKHSEKILRDASKSECVEYFGKKRDLVLGSAPTDVLTAVLSLIASAVAIGFADSKEDRISRSITGAFPVIAGMGVSTILTARLYSGGKGMMLGALSSMALSGFGSAINRIIYPKSKSAETNIAKTSDKSQEKGKEVLNA